MLLCSTGNQKRTERFKLRSVSYAKISKNDGKMLQRMKLIETTHARTLILSKSTLTKKILRRKLDSYVIKLLKQRDSILFPNEITLNNNL